MDSISIDRMVFEVSGLSLQQAEELARHVGAGLAKAAPAGASADLDKLSVTLDGPPDTTNLPRLANTIVNSLLRQIG